MRAIGDDERRAKSRLKNDGFSSGVKGLSAILARVPRGSRAKISVMIVPSDGELILRIVLSAAVGGLIGLERELTGHAAGLRTHISVALGATLFGIVGSYGFAPFVGDGVTVAPDRVASTVVMGIGFLGGGAILKHDLTVKGLTTAASLWVTAAVGLGIALGAYVVTGFAAGLLLLILVVLKWPEDWFRRRRGEPRGPS